MAWLEGSDAHGNPAEVVDLRLVLLGLLLSGRVAASEGGSSAWIEEAEATEDMEHSVGCSAAVSGWRLRARRAGTAELGPGGIAPLGYALRDFAGCSVVHVMYLCGREVGTEEF